jgi:hypothetical protein
MILNMLWIIFLQWHVLCQYFDQAALHKKESKYVSYSFMVFINIALKCYCEIRGYNLQFYCSM